MLEQEHNPESGSMSPMPTLPGIGLKPEHYRDLLEDLPSLGFLEIHVENYMGAGGPPHRYLAALAEHYDLSFHGVAASLGGASPLDRAHLRRWRELVDRYSPRYVSEHLAWAAHDGITLHDLLPLPYTEESLSVFCGHVDQMQDVLGREILVENPSRYVDFAESTIPETEFLCEAAWRTGCGLLLDVNNVYVSARNQGEDPRDYLRRIPAELVGEIHLAGHSAQTADGQEILIDDHGSEVPGPVWSLYTETVARIGGRPTLIEWDTDVPELGTLLEEAARAERAAAIALESDGGSRYANAC